MVTMTVFGTNLGKADVWRVEPEVLPFVWPRIRDILEDKGQDTVLLKFDPEHIYHLIVSDGMDLWIGIHRGEIDMMWLMTLDIFPKCRVYRTLWAGGDNFRKYLKAISKMEQYAIVVGASQAEIEGRIGWSRVFPDYTLDRYVLTKNVARKWGH